MKSILNSWRNLDSEDRLFLSLFLALVFLLPGTIALAILAAHFSR